MASILFFIVGFLCGHFCQKERKQSSAASESVPSAGGQTQIPYYDDVVLKQEVELKENVAYMVHCNNHAIIITLYSNDIRTQFFTFVLPIS